MDSAAVMADDKCLCLAVVTVEAWAVSADSQEWVADLAVASEVDLECLRCLDLVEDSVGAMVLNKAVRIDGVM